MRPPLPKSPRRRLLLLACSKRKRSVSKPLPAIQLYNGPAFQALRNAIKESRVPATVTVRILSGKHGLLRTQTLIRAYDHRLDPDKDHAVLVAARRSLRRLARRESLTEVFAFLGRDYSAALPRDWPNKTQPRVIFAEGPPGARVKQMLQWLETDACSL